MSKYQKSSLRKTCLNKRKSLATSVQKLASKLIYDKIITCKEYENARNIGVYVACHKEIDLSKLWKDTVQKDKNYFFPKIYNQTTMVFLPASKETIFTKNKWGILEPEVNFLKNTPPCKLDIIFIPLVAFDKFGNRIGMGGGYYDRLLATERPKLLVGVAYEIQKQPIIEVDSWDIKLDLIITEKTIYDCTNKL